MLSGSPGVPCLRHVPSAPLSRFVHSIWLSDGVAQDDGREAVLPNGSLQLLISLDDRPVSVFDGAGTLRTLSGIAVSGAQSRAVVIGSGQLGSILCVAFRPGGAGALLGVPSGDFTNAHAPLESIWGPAAGEMRDRVQEAGSAAARLRAVDHVLLARVRPSLEPHPAVSYALAHFSAVAQARSVGAVTEALDLSARRFIELFRRDVGLRPKLFCRIRRFQRSLGLVGAKAAPTWAEVALRCGYFDQAHFNREFRRLSGLNPSRYVSERGEFQNHVPIREKVAG